MKLLLTKCQKSKNTLFFSFASENLWASEYDNDNDEDDDDEDIDIDDDVQMEPSWRELGDMIGRPGLYGLLFSIAAQYCPWDIVLLMWGFVWPAEHRTPGRKCTHNMGPICSSQPSAPTACFAHS